MMENMTSRIVPTEEEIKAAIKRIAQQKDQRQKYHAKKKEQLASDPELAAKIKEQHKEYRSRPEVKARMSEQRKAYHARPEVKEKMKETHKQYQEKNKQAMAIIKERAKELNMSVNDYIAASL